jgi:Ala-tRNA(Pro) deacylase
MGKEQTEMIKKMLDDSGVDYNMFKHEPVYTSEQASRVRGVELKSGVKALVFKTNDGKFVLGLVAADRKISERKLAKEVGAEAVVLAKPAEVLQKTGCEIGSVHPFGILHNLPIYMDESILENDLVNFNVGMHTVSVQMYSKDLVKINNPKICDIAKAL